jgi:putative ABC transport system permease protein
MSELGRRIARIVYGVREGLRLAFVSLDQNRLRSGLAILAVAIGVTAVVVMAALVTGIRGSVAEGIEAAGHRTLFLMRFDLSDVQLIQTGGQPPWMNNPPITLEEARRVGELPGVSRAVVSIALQNPGTEGGLTVRGGGNEATGVIGAGESESWPEYRAVAFAHGRNFTAREVAEASNVIVVSRPLAEDLFGSPGAAVGQRVLVGTGGGGTVPFRVVGVFQTEPNIFEGPTSHLAIVPHTSAVRRLNVSPDWLQVLVVPVDEVPLERVEDQIVGALRSMRGLAPRAANDFAVLRSTQLLALFDQFTAVFFAVMIALSSLGLVVGGIGVVGIMMISVTERTREIGIRKAVGASRPEILWQFLVEAAALTLVGGALGLLTGAVLAWGLASLTPVPAAIPLWAVAVSLAVAGLTGMVFGLVPAIRAARMEPVRALRYE